LGSFTDLILLTSMIAWIWGISRSIRMSKSMTRARQTFLRTSGSSSLAKWNKFSMKVSMFNISACVLLIMNWLTQAIACDLILGDVCLKNWRNFGIMKLSGRFNTSESSISAESSHIFCSAPNDPSQTL